MTKSTTLGLIAVALATALFSSGCMDTQQAQANADCKANYVGRQKSACEFGVKNAFQTAKNTDGKSRDQKYQAALGRCQKLEKPLIKPCEDGVKNFKTELAKVDNR